MQDETVISTQLYTTTHTRTVRSLYASRISRSQGHKTVWIIIETKGKGKIFVYYSVTPIERASHPGLMRHLYLHVPSQLPPICQAPGRKATSTIISLAGGSPTGHIRTIPGADALTTRPRDR